MGYLLDTNIVSEFVRPRPEARVLSYVESLGRDEIYLSVITIAEITQGISRLPESKKRRLLADWLEKEILAAYGDRVLPFDLAAAQIWGPMTANMFRRGQNVSFSDTSIAATAICHGHTLVTRNVNDFFETGVKVIDPWALSPPTQT